MSDHSAGAALRVFCRGRRNLLRFGLRGGDLPQPERRLEVDG